jgi:hypothetical protein
MNDNTFIERLFEEKNQLNEKVEKLESFLMSEKIAEIEPIQKTLLSVQLHAMKTYLMTLIERIAWLSR